MNAADLVATLLRSHAVRVGGAIAVNGSAADEKAVAVRVVGLTADAALIERAAMPSEGGPTVRRARLRTTDRTRADQMVGDAITAIARLQHREVDLGGMEPPWSFSISSATAATLRHLGVDPAALVGSGQAADWGRLPRTDPEMPGIDVRMVGSRLLARSITIPAAGRAPAMFLDETTGLPALTVLAPLPDTLVIGCVGRRLGEVIEHPALPPAPVIVQMRQAPLGMPEVHLVFEDVRETVATPPREAPEWLGIGERSRRRPLFS